MPSTSAPAPPKIAILLQSLPMGGAERSMLTLADGFCRQGCQVDLLLVVRRGALLAEIPDAARLIELGTVSRWKLLTSLVKLPWDTFRSLPKVLWHNRQPKVMRSLPKIVRYLQRERPDALLTTLPNNNLIALWAKWLARTPIRVVVCEGNTISKDMPPPSHLFEGHWPRYMRPWYPRADAVVSVSDGVADDLTVVAGLRREQITTIYNPLDLDRVRQLAAAAVDHPWFADGEPPVILAAGRLAPQKDFPTLLRAFARVCGQRDARLVILGEGPERPVLERLVAELGLADRVALPGVEANPFAFMARARVFVLSSAWEGLGNVLIEALACGCPVVSTDCPSGPSEILQNGRFGRLVSVGDDAALAEAIIRILDEPADISALQARAQAFDIGIVCARYLELFRG